MEQMRRHLCTSLFTRVFALAAVALTVASPAWSDPPSDGTIGSEPVMIVGYPLGRAFTMPRCTKDKRGFTDFATRGACWTIEWNDETNRRVWWPPGKTPIGYAMWASVRDGILVGVRFDTTGVHEQDRVLNQLREKFGQPSSFNREPMQNLLGMKFERYVAVWKGAQVYVEFNGVLDEIDYGLVSVETPAEHARRVRSLQESRPPKL